jgi:hypothetical protein
MAGRLTFFFEEKLLALYSYRLFGCTAIQTARQRHGNHLSVSPLQPSKRG